MSAHAAIERSIIIRLQERVLGYVVDPILKLSKQLKPGTSITITHDCVLAHIGREEFILSSQPYELEADLEAFNRLTARRIAR